MKKKLRLKKEVKEEIQNELLSLLGIVAIVIWWIIFIY